ncbi:MAG TPA: competence/damage-inducible protein A [Acidimicrobiales bacterium]|nr:competence/damage-inducible protein A [Acidimicrobiales bacterium]
MRCEVVAVGTELLLGQVVDTNSAYIGDRLALSGIDCHFHTKVGDNQARITSALRIALDRSDAVLVCGGLGPTADDITREAIAEVMGVALVRDAAMVERIRVMFEARQRDMAGSNARQADLPQGATFIPQERGTAPGLICPVGDGDKVIYAVPGVPFEMREMLDRAVLPDLRRRSPSTSVILSRMVRTWGVPESTLGEMVADRFEALEGRSNPTIAFLASGIEGIKIRITAKAESEAEAVRLLDDEEAELRAVLGDVVFGIDEQGMERVVADLLVERAMTVGVAESLTGGLVGARLAETEGASKWFRGSIVCYDSKVKFDLLDVPEGPVVSADAAEAMALGACRRLEADAGISVTGVAGPATQDDQPVGTVFMAVAVAGKVESRLVHFTGDRQHIRQFSTISLLDMLRRRLLSLPPSNR